MIPMKAKGFLNIIIILVSLTSHHTKRMFSGADRNDWDFGGGRWNYYKFSEWHHCTQRGGPGCVLLNHGKQEAY